jgi:hypothetical protein
MRLASGSSDNTVRVWDVASGTCVATLEVGGGREGQVAWLECTCSHASHLCTLVKGAATMQTCFCTHVVPSFCFTPPAGARKGGLFNLLEP